MGLSYAFRSASEIEERSRCGQGFPLVEAYQCNLPEENERALDVNGNGIHLDVRPYQKHHATVDSPALVLIKRLKKSHSVTGGNTLLINRLNQVRRMATR